MLSRVIMLCCWTRHPTMGHFMFYLCPLTTHPLSPSTIDRVTFYPWKKITYCPIFCSLEKKLTFLQTPSGNILRGEGRGERGEGRGEGKLWGRALWKMEQLSANRVLHSSHGGTDSENDMTPQFLIIVNL